MKIDELINILEQFKTKYGNLQVAICENGHNWTRIRFCYFTKKDEQDIHGYEQFDIDENLDDEFISICC